MQKFVAYEEARRIVLEGVPQQPEQEVPLSDALGLVLARDVRSPEGVPAFDNSAMDGFAVRAADLDSPPARLEILEEVPAGHAPQKEVSAGGCAEIMTGAPVPGGADAVVRVEKTERVEEGYVQINERVEAGNNIRRAAEDIQEGQLLFEAGQHVTPPVVGVLAMLGMSEVTVTKPPRVAVIATGDELVDVEATLQPGQIRDSNSPLLASQVRAAGGRPQEPLRAGDDEPAIRQAVEQALEADVLLVAGGMSVGEHDYVRPVLQDMGLDLHFWKVRQRPGKPFGFGLLRGKPVFGLPGNPTTASVCFEMYVRPALGRMIGQEQPLAPRYPAILDAPVRKRKNLHYFSRGMAAPGEDGRLHVRAQGPQQSGFFVPMAQANCIIHLPEGMENPTAGTPVDIEWLAWGRAPQNSHQPELQPPANEAR